MKFTSKKLLLTLLVLTAHGQNSLNSSSRYGEVSIDQLERLGGDMVTRAQENGRSPIAQLDDLTGQIARCSMEQETDLDAVLAQIDGIGWMEWPEHTNTVAFQADLHRSVADAKNAVANQLEKLSRNAEDARTRAAAAKRAEEMREEEKRVEEMREKEALRFAEEARLAREKERQIQEKAQLERELLEQQYREDRIRAEQLRVAEEKRKATRRAELLTEGAQKIETREAARQESIREKVSRFASSLLAKARSSISTRNALAEAEARKREEHSRLERIRIENARLEKIRLAEAARLTALRQAEEERSAAAEKGRDLSGADALWYKDGHQQANAAFDAQAQEELSRRRAALQASDPRQPEFVGNIIEILRSIEALPRKITRFGQMNGLGDDERCKVSVSKLNDIGWELLAVEIQSHEIGITLLQEATQKDKISALALKNIVARLNIR